VANRAALHVAIVLAIASAACSRGGAVADAGEDGATPLLDICDAFTEVGTACPLASPVRCFPECEAGGCFCRATSEGPRWACETDLSCVPDCAPIDDACGVTGPAGDAGGGDSD